MTNTIYFDVYRDDESVSTSSEFSSGRSDFPDENEWRNNSSSVYSTIGKTIRSWIRSPMPPGPPKIIPFEDLAISFDELKSTGNLLLRPIDGERSYDYQVFRATLSTGQDVEVKKLLYSSEERGFESGFDFAAELSKVYRLKHDNIVELLGYCLEEDNRILVHQFATKGSLHDLLHGRGPKPTWHQRVKIAFGAARGLQYLHNEGMHHQNIRSTTVVVSDDFVAKITDISVLEPYPPLPWHAARGASRNYDRLSPEKRKVPKKDDIFGYGVVLLELLTGRKQVDCNLPMGEQNLVIWATPRLREGKFYQYIDPELNTNYPPRAVAKLARVAARCIQYDSRRRPDMNVVVNDIQPLLEYEKPDISVSPQTASSR